MKRWWVIAWLLLLSAVVIPVSSTLAQSCGVERWSIKTGTDAGAPNINTSTISSTTIASLVSLSQPSSLPRNTRLSPTETTVFSIDATLVGYKFESDSDYHLVIADASGNTMIVEIPSPNCVGDTSPFSQAITQARAQFDAQFTASDHFVNVNVPIKVTGVGFFDTIHGQTGVAPNGIELHPVLAIDFNSSLPPAPNPPSTVPELPSAAGQQWQYRVITNTNADALLTQLNALTDGWELVNVVIDDQRLDRYVAYLKRPNS